MAADKFTRAERIRLEAFAQAVSASAVVRLGGRSQFPAMEDLLRRAEEIEIWLKQAKEDA